MIVAVLAIGVFPFKAGTWRHINLAADDGLDAHFPLPHGKKSMTPYITPWSVMAMLSMPSSLARASRLFDLTGTVQQTVLCMDVQM